MRKSPAMKFQFAGILIALFAFTPLALAQEPSSKPAPKKKQEKDNAPKKDDSKKDKKDAAKTAKKELPLPKKLAKHFGAIKEVKSFLELVNTGVKDVVEGKDGSAAFGSLEFEDDERVRETLATLKQVGAHKFKFAVVEAYFSIGIEGEEGLTAKSLLLFKDGEVIIVPGRISKYEENFKHRGESADELSKDLKFLDVLGQEMRKKAREAKRSKNFPFVGEEHFELFRSIMKSSMTKERWREDIKKQAGDRTKFFLKLKSKDKVTIHYDIDDALFFVEDKDGKEIGALTVDFDSDKKKASIQLKRFRPKE